jgi:hypothetical protein
MSEGGKSASRQAAVIACSQLETVITDTPAALHQRFRHLGVWSEAQIAEVANHGRAQSLAFTNTEIFPVAVSRKQVRKLAEPYGGWSATPGPQTISPQLFAAIYQAGQSSP